MIRKVIEYLRKKNKITVEDLVVEICSGNMYYKYIAGTKNMSNKNLKLIKDRLGADDLTKDEIAEYKKDLNKITLKIMRYYSTKSELEKDVEPLIELEQQLILNEELFIDYINIKLNYLLVSSNFEEIESLLSLLNEYYDEMSDINKLLYLKTQSFINVSYMKSVENESKNIDMILSHSPYNINYGSFYVTLALNYLNLKDRIKALKCSEIATELFQRDMNLVGQIKAANIKIMLLMENRKYKEALDLLLITYENCKNLKQNREMFISLFNIINCYLAINDKANAIKYWNIVKRKIVNVDDLELRRCFISNTSICLLTNFEYFELTTQLDELIDILNSYGPYDNITINNLLKYHSITDVDEKIEFIETELLSSLLGKAYFSYCKWLLDTCVNYYLDNRMYKKASNFETAFMEEFRKYYFC